MPYIFLLLVLYMILTCRSSYVARFLKQRRGLVLTRCQILFNSIRRHLRTVLSQASASLQRRGRIHHQILPGDGSEEMQTVRLPERGVLHTQRQAFSHRFQLAQAGGHRHATHEDGNLRRGGLQPAEVLQAAGHRLRRRG